MLLLRNGERDALVAVGGSMKTDEQHVAEPGLVVLDITAADGTPCAQ
ncbi:DUF6207 family protein [Streptomyces sp. NPDC002164]